jgi:hypothetical protein
MPASENTGRESGVVGRMGKGALVFTAACAGTAPPPASSVHPVESVDLVATFTDQDHVAIAQLGATGVRVIGTVDQVMVFGWLDRHTLIAMSDGGDVRGVGAHVQRVVDGVVTETVDLRDDEWPSHSASKLELTAAGEVFLARCTDEDEDEDGHCHAHAYAEVFPERRPRIETPPAGVVPGRTQHFHWQSNADPWPLPPTVAGPSDVGVTVEPDSPSAPAYGGAVSVVCRHAAVTTLWPSGTVHYVPNYLHAARVRWVQTTPPLYEAYAEFVGSDWAPRRFYFRPCAVAPLPGYVWVADGITGTYEGEDDEGEWTFWRAGARVGTLRGTPAIRPAQ